MPKWSSRSTSRGPTQHGSDGIGRRSPMLIQKLNSVLSYRQLATRIGELLVEPLASFEGVGQCVPLRVKVRLDPADELCSWHSICTISGRLTCLVAADSLVFVASCCRELTPCKQFVIASDAIERAGSSETAIDIWSRINFWASTKRVKVGSLGVAEA